MTQQAVPLRTGTADAGERIAQLRQVLALVEEIAGVSGHGRGEAALDEAARVSSAYATALPIVQRRFDRLAAQTAQWAAAGASALAALTARSMPTGAAARRLAAELERALAELREIVAG
jgi:hypothetical protein